MKKLQKGFSLIEILISLGIVASLLLLVFIVVPRVQAQLRVNETSEQLTGMVASLKGLYTTAKDFNNLTTVRAVKGHIYYDNMPVDKTNGTIKNSWDGDVYFGPDTGTQASQAPRYTGDIASRRFMITYTNVPDNECAKLSSSAGTNFMMVVVNGNDKFPTSTTSYTTASDQAVLVRLNSSPDMEIHPDLALDQCSKEGVGSSMVRTKDSTGTDSTTAPGNVIQFIGQ